MSQQISDFQTACRAVLADSENRALNYAVGYARDGLQLLTPDAIQLQCLYILNNVTRWRTPAAKETRETYKRLSKFAAWKE